MREKGGITMLATDLFLWFLVAAWLVVCWGLVQEL